MTGQIQARTAELEASRQQAHKALDDYLEVLGFVAHELRAPWRCRMQLNAIDGGYAGRLPETMQRPLAALRRAVDYGWSGPQLQPAQPSGRRGLKAQPREITDLGAEVLARPRESRERRRATHEGGGRRGRGPVQGTGLLRCDGQLVGNAVKYGREEPRAIRLAGRRKESGRGHNEGVGVAPDKLGSLFQKFFRVRIGTRRQGTGGLYLVRRLVSCRGEVGVESE